MIRKALWQHIDYHLIKPLLIITFFLFVKYIFFKFVDINLF